MRSAQVIATPAPPMASTARQDSVPPPTGTRIPAARLRHARRGRAKAWGPCVSAAAAPLPALAGEALVQKSVRESSSWPQLSRRESILWGRARVWGRRGQGITIVPALSPNSFSGTGEGNGDRGPKASRVPSHKSHQPWPTNCRAQTTQGSVQLFNV